MTRIFQFTGIRGRLLAFESVAAMTAVATVIAWISFGGVGDSLKRIVTDNIPTVVLAASLAEQSGIITATAPALAAAESEADRHEPGQFFLRILRAWIACYRVWMLLF